MRIRPLSNLPDFVLDACIAILLIVLLTASYFYLPANISFGLMLIVGFWSVDVFLKKILAYKNITAFADLSFTSLVFAGGEGISLVKSALSSNPIIQHLFVIFPAAIILSIAWIANIAICRDLENRSHTPSTSRRITVWCFSFMFAFFSVCCALYVHSIGR